MMNNEKMVYFECVYDFVDEYGNDQYCIDGYPEDENGFGKVIATIVKTKHNDIAVVWHDNGYRFNDSVCNIIKETKERILKGEM